MTRFFADLTSVAIETFRSIILLLVFMGIIIPIGLLIKLIGKDLLHLKLDSNCSSYWIKRNDKGSKRKSMLREY